MIKRQLYLELDSLQFLIFSWASDLCLQFLKLCFDVTDSRDELLQFPLNAKVKLTLESLLKDKRHDFTKEAQLNSV